MPISLFSWINPKPSMLLATTSLSYTLPTLVAFYYGNYITSIGCAFLTLTSVYFHTQRTTTAYLVDQCGVWIVFTRSFFDAFAGTYLSIAITAITHLYNWTVYFSPWRKYFTFHPDEQTSELFHSTLHIIPAIVITIQQMCLLQPLPLESAP
jgi:hypothetical protein